MSEWNEHPGSAPPTADRPWYPAPVPVTDAPPPPPMAEGPTAELPLAQAQMPPAPPYQPSAPPAPERPFHVEEVSTGSKSKKWLMGGLAMLAALALFAGGFSIGRTTADTGEETAARTEPTTGSAQDRDPAIASPGSAATPESTVPQSNTPSTAAPNNSTQTPGSNVTPETNPPALDGNDEPIAAVAAAVGGSVVRIETGFGVGSGFLYSDEGHIFTAAHVVNGASSLSIQLADGTTVDGTVLGTSTEVDVAVVKIDNPGEDLQVASLALNSKPRVGELAIAIGSPYGLDQTVTSGIVSAIDRFVPENQNIAPLIQTDAAINSGNSGGALLNRAGQVIGINVSIQTASGGNDGIGFAVPIDLAWALSDRLGAGQPVAFPLLGVGPTEELVPGRPGAVVGQVTPASGAEQAGVQAGDRITAIDGTTVRTFDELRSEILLLRGGDKVELSIERDGREFEVTATLGGR